MTKQQTLAATALLFLSCAACATVEKVSPATRLLEAMHSIEEAKKLEAAGRYKEAVALIEHAKKEGESSRALEKGEWAAYCLNLLGNIHRRQGNMGMAGLMYERALALLEKAPIKDNPSIAAVLNKLARLRLAQQQLDEALPLFRRALALSEDRLRKEVLGFSETRLTSLLLELRTEEETLYTLAREYPNDDRVRNLALTIALLRKGRSVEEISNTSRIIYRGLTEVADREAFERLRGLRTQLAMLSFTSHGQLPAVDNQQRIAELTKQADALEADLASRSAPLRTRHALPPAFELIKRVKDSLPRDGVLIEFITYHASPPFPSSGADASQLPSELSYLALLLFADGHTHALDLGPAAPIDGAALRLHAALAGKSSTYQAAAQEFYSLAFRRLVPLFGNSRRLFLSPDGQLALIPFAALHDGNRFLGDAFDITYVTSGKDLLPRTEDILLPSSVVVLAAPEFGSPSTAPSAEAPLQRSASNGGLFSSLRAGFVDQPWPELPGTHKEAETIQRLIPQARLFLGRDATKEVLLNLATPSVLHIATHGFFLEDIPAEESTRTAPPSALLKDDLGLVSTRAVNTFGAVGDAGPLQSPPEPLLRSGLVLPSASALTHSGPQRREDSLVTALELAGLNLWGTQLVVLSACETGRGDIKLGQGVYGLRRALVSAGAETLVTSLWKVDDETTRELMEAYYGNLLAGQGRAAALREAMRTLRQKQPHPHFWAPFIVIGQAAPLRGVTAPADEWPNP